MSAPPQHAPEALERAAAWAHLAAARLWRRGGAGVWGLSVAALACWVACSREAPAPTLAAEDAGAALEAPAEPPAKAEQGVGRVESTRADVLGALGRAREEVRRGAARGGEAARGAVRRYAGPCAELRDLDADGRDDLEVRWSYDARGHAVGYTRRWQPHYKTPHPDVDVRVKTDAQGRPVESVASVKGGGREVWRQTEAWDAAGRRVRRGLDDGADGEEDEAWEWAYTLDEAGRVVEEVERSLEVSFVGPERARIARLKERRVWATRTTYDAASGWPVLRTQGPAEEEAGRWRVVLRVDEAGRVVQAQTTDRDGAVVAEERTAWDGQGNMLSQEVDRLELGTGRLRPESRTRWTYRCWHTAAQDD